MARRTIAVSVSVALLIAAGVIAGVAAFRPAPYQLYTHCGIRDVTLDGTHYYADPPLNDGNGNPPAQWGNPYEDGVLFQRDADTVVFVSWSGNRATFSTHPRSGIPTIEICS